MISFRSAFKHDADYLCFEINNKCLFIDTFSISLSINSLLLEYCLLDSSIVLSCSSTYYFPASRVVYSRKNNPLVYVTSIGLFIPSLGFSFYYSPSTASASGSSSFHVNTSFSFVPDLHVLSTDDSADGHIKKIHNQLLSSGSSYLKSLASSHGVFTLIDLDPIKSSDLLEISKTNRTKASKSSYSLNTSGLSSADIDDDDDQSLDSYSSCLQDYLSANPPLINQPVSFLDFDHLSPRKALLRNSFLLLKADAFFSFLSFTDIKILSFYFDSPDIFMAAIDFTSFILISPFIIIDLASFSTFNCFLCCSAIWRCHIPDCWSSS